MTYTRDDLAMVERHIRQAEQHVVSQEKVITGLKLGGHDTNTADELLEEFRAMLQTHRDHRDLIAADLA